MEPVAVHGDVIYLRLNADYSSERSAVKNTVSDFENVLHTAVQLDRHRTGLVDLHINAQLDSNGLKTRGDFTLSILENFPSFNDVMDRTIKAKYNKNIDITPEYNRYLYAMYEWTDEDKVTPH